MCTYRGGERGGINPNKETYQLCCAQGFRPKKTLYGHVADLVFDSEDQLQPIRPAARDAIQFLTRNLFDDRQDRPLFNMQPTPRLELQKPMALSTMLLRC